MKRYLRDPNAPTHLRRLFESARSDGLDEKRRRRVADRLGLSVWGAGTTNTSSDAPATTAPWSSVATVAVAVAALVGGGAAYVRASHSHRIEAPPAVAASAVVTNVAAPTSTAPGQQGSTGTTEVSALPDVRAERTAARPRHAAPPAEAKGSANDLRLEIAALDGVRRETEGGRPRRALELLDDYAATFAHGRLSEEAAVLRIEALHASGDRTEADRLARRLLRGSPNTPYAARVRAALVDVSRE